MTGVTPTNTGILAIWNDVTAGCEADFDAWFQTEHLAERLGVPGFRLGRRHEAISGTRQFFNFYEVDAPEVLSSKAYLDRLNNPTPWTRKIMSEVFRNMIRAVCRRTVQRGTYRGAFAVTARFDAPQSDEALASVIDQIADHLGGESGFARGEVWAAVDTGVSAAAEERLRGGDRKIAHCILIETLRQPDAERAAEALTRRFANSADAGIFRLLCERRNAAA